MIQVTSTETFDCTTHHGVKVVLRKWSVKRRRQYNEKMAPLLHKQRLIQQEEGDFWQAQEEANKEAAIAVCNCSHGEHDGPCKADGCVCRHGVLPGAVYVDHIARIEAINGILNNELVPERLRWAVDRIYAVDETGAETPFEIDGKAIDVEVLIELGPDDLSQEIGSKIESMLFPSPEETKNSSSPITSDPQMDGATKNGLVDLAKPSENTNGAIAASTSPVM